MPECLDFLAGAVARRRLVVLAAAKPLEHAHGDGRSIVLADPGTTPAAAAWLQVVAQALLVSMGSLDGAVMRRLVGRPDAARRYVWLEVLRGLAVRGGELPPGFVRLVPPGRGTATTSAAESLRLALAGQPAGQPPAMLGTLKPLAVLRRLHAEQGFRALTGGFRRDARSADPGAPEELTDDDTAEASVLLRLFSNPAGGRNPLAKLLGTLLGARRGRGASLPGSGAGGEMPIGQVASAARRGVHALRSRHHFEAGGVTASGSGHDVRYPEWDQARGAYRPDWAHVQEVEPWRADGPAVVHGACRAAPRALLRQLAGLGVHHEMRRGQFDGTEFDAGRLVERAIDVRCGVPDPREDVYRASLQTRRDLGVVIVADASGSTQERDAGAVRIFDHHLRVTYQVGEALHRLGDRVALYGFQSWGRRQVQLARLKAHGEAWDTRIARRCAQLEPQGYTRTGAAVRHGTHLLRHELRLPSRLLLLVTDGFPYDQDYEGEHAAADTTRALFEARASGTACVCLCVGGSQARARLGEVFGAANVLAAERPEELYRRLGVTIRAALAAVAHRSPAPGARRVRAEHAR